MLKALRRIPASNVAYVLLLLAFVSLGLLVAALALGSDFAVIAGIALIACFGGSVAGFRRGGRQLAEAGPVADNASMFSTPLRRDEVDQYLLNYRGSAARPVRVAPDDRSADRPTPAMSAPRRQAA